MVLEYRRKEEKARGKKDCWVDDGQLLRYLRLLGVKDFADQKRGVKKECEGAPAW